MSDRATWLMVHYPRTSVVVFATAQCMLFSRLTA